MNDVELTDQIGRIRAMGMANKALLRAAHLEGEERIRFLWEKLEDAHREIELLSDVVMRLHGRIAERGL